MEIAQLQIKHEEEMSRMKSDFEKQLHRKLKRNSTFDSQRDLDQILTERDSLRELSNTLRWLLCELAKYCTVCEDDLNNTFIEELQKHGVLNSSIDDVEENIENVSVVQHKRVKFAPDMSGILSIVDDPSLVEFITQNKDLSSDFRVNFDDCLERLRSEALTILGLSEHMITKNKEEGAPKEINHSSEEEDGLKRNSIKRREKVARAKSLNESLLNGNRRGSVVKENGSNTKSLPIYSSATESDEIPKSELNVKLHELKNRLVKSEDEKKSLEEELAGVISRHDSLVTELSATKVQLETYETQKEVFTER